MSVPLQPLLARRTAAALDRPDRDQQPRLADALRWRPQPDLLDPQELGPDQPNINFLGDPWNALASLCLANIWRGIPFFAVSILAGLQAVPDELHEAAALDGANAWQRFLAVTLPVIRNIMLITTLFSIIWTFSDFQLIYVLTKGGPANATHVFGTYSYQIMAVGDSARRRPSRSTCSPSWRSSPSFCCATSARMTRG